MMKRSTAVVLVLWVPLAACAKPADKRRPPMAAERAVDRRPDVGLSLPGEDLTEMVRQQNLPGYEPPLPKRRGVATPTSARPITRRTKDGFVTTLPGYAQRTVTPAYHRGKLVTGGYRSYDVHAINAVTGKPSWSLHLSDDGPTDPACEDGVCVFNTYSCTVFGVEVETGKSLWSWYLGSPQLATPVVHQGVVYTSYPERSGQSDANFVLASFDLKTGKPGWRRWIDAEVNATPVTDGKSVWVATRFGTLYEFGAKDGEVLAVRRSRIASPPVIAAGTLLFGRDEPPHENEMLVTSQLILPHLERVAAPQRAPIRPKPRPLVARHRLVTIEQGTVVATSRETGKRLWQRDFGDERPADVPSPLLYAGSSILMATSAGNVLRIQPDSGDVIAAFALRQGAIASQPIAVDGWIYAGTVDGAVVAFDTGSPELTGWEMLGGGPDRRGSRDGEGT